MENRKEQLKNEIEQAVRKKDSALANAESFSTEFPMISEHFSDLADELQEEIDNKTHELRLIYEQENVATMAEKLRQKLGVQDGSEDNQEMSPFRRKWGEGKYQECAEYIVQDMRRYFDDIESDSNRKSNLERIMASCLGVILRRHAHDRG